MRKFLRDVILRAAEMIREKESAAGPQPGTVSSMESTFDSSPVPGTAGRSCTFCRRQTNLFEVSTDEVRDFICGEHLAMAIVDWSIAREYTVVRL